MGDENTNDLTGNENEELENENLNADATATESDDTDEISDDEADDEMFYLADDDDDSDELEESDDNQEAETDALQDETETNKESADDASGEKEALNAPNVNDSDFYDRVTETAKERVKAITGKDYDEFNPKHNVILTVETGKIAKHIEAEQNALAQSNTIIKANGGEKFQAFLREELGNRPNKFVNALKAAEMSGDYSQTLAFMQETAKKFKGESVKEEAKAKMEKLNQGKPSFKPVAKKPPVTISPNSGHGVRGGKRIDSDDMLSPYDLGLEIDD